MFFSQIEIDFLLFQSILINIRFKNLFKKQIMPILKLLFFCFFKHNKSGTSVIDYFCLASAQLSVLGQVTFELGNSAFLFAFFIGN